MTGAGLQHRLLTQDTLWGRAAARRAPHPLQLVGKARLCEKPRTGSHRSLPVYESKDKNVDILKKKK